MFECNRNSADPVLRVFVQEHSLNLLKWPRTGIQIGDLVISRNDRTFSPVNIEEIFASDRPFDVEKKQVDLAPFDTSFSSAVKIGTVVSFIEGLASRLGMKASGKLKSAYATASSAKVKVKGGRKTSGKLKAVSEWLKSSTVDPQQSLMREGDKLYLVTALVKSNKLEVVATNADNNNIEVDVSSTELADASATLSTKKSVGTSIIYKSKELLTIGVELHELVADGDYWRLNLPSGWVDVRGDDEIGKKGPRTIFLEEAESTGNAFISFVDD
ncbi:hypothetical protein [uncultured Roseibium sp.]|uniref:hypothetical protein n=1 Tax=uncultured Roseibium sp. TaxID=1936171 RepID=UPI0026136064|nr:hypothetical protein [uncultured Roseibium sp.]